MTEGEENRLIQENMDLALGIAASHRGERGIPIEELRAEAIKALVEAARSWVPISRFTIYASKYVDMELRQFISRWASDVLPDGHAQFISDWGIDPDSGDPIWVSTLEEREYWETIYPDVNFPVLAASPEEMALLYEDMAEKREAIRAAILSLSRREQKMIELRFLRDPAWKIEDIARQNRVSYFKAVKVIHTALRKMRKVVAAIDKKVSDRVAAPPPSRAPGQSALSPLARQKMSGG